MGAEVYIGFVVAAGVERVKSTIHVTNLLPNLTSFHLNCNLYAF